MLPGVVRCCGSCARSACWRPRQRPARAGRVRRSASRRHRHEDSDDRNVGNAPLALKGRGWQLADAAFAFPVAPDCMLATLVPGGGCAFAVSFQPVAARGYTDTLTVVNDAPGSPNPIPMSGTGVPAATPLASAVTISASIVDFVAQHVGAPGVIPMIWVTMTSTQPVMGASWVVATPFELAPVNTFREGGEQLRPRGRPARSASATGRPSPVSSPARRPRRYARRHAEDGHQRRRRGPARPALAGQDQIPLGFSLTGSGTASPARTATFTNNGAAPLTVANVAITGTEAADFAQCAGRAAGRPCPARPAPG